MSVYLGSALDTLVKRRRRTARLHTVEALADLTADGTRLTARRELTDRNRTTPFAFTGNKFEFRAVGSSANCAWPMTILNAAVADSCRTIRRAHREEGRRSRQRRRSRRPPRGLPGDVRACRFEGNNYSDAWRQGSGKKRGLANHTSDAGGARRSRQ